MSSEFDEAFKALQRWIADRLPVGVEVAVESFIIRHRPRCGVEIADSSITRNRAFRHPVSIARFIEEWPEIRESLEDIGRHCEDQEAEFTNLINREIRE